jgi:uncharacterized protein (TIGR02001 family)
MMLARVAVLAVIVLASAPVQAELKGSLTFASDYFYRGYSKSRGNPVLQANLEYEHDSGWFGGMWVSQVSFDDKAYADRAQAELNPYFGWGAKIGDDWRVELSAGRYLYAGKIFGRSADYNEFYAGLHYGDLLTARLAVAYDAYNRKATTLAYELLGRYSLLDNVQLSAGLGFNQAQDLFDYDNFYWNAGITWYPTRFLSLDIRYVDADSYRFHGPYSRGFFAPHNLDQRYLFSISAGF